MPTPSDKFNIMRNPRETVANVYHYFGETAMYLTSFGMTATLVQAVGDSIEGDSPSNEIAYFALVTIIGSATVASAKLGETYFSDNNHRTN